MTVFRVSLLTFFLITTGARAADVLMWHNDKAHHGLNNEETILTPANVNERQFGKLFSFSVDGCIYAQPLVVSDLAIGRRNHTAVIAATEHDSVYAFDTAANSGESAVLWHASLIDPARKIMPVPCADVNTQDLVPEIGITSTPAIDRERATIYVVTRTKEIRTVTPPPSPATSTAISAATSIAPAQPTSQSTPFDEAHYVQKVHALDLTTGAEKPGSPVVIGDSYFDSTRKWHDDTAVEVAGRGSGKVDGIVRFNALREHQRCGLMLDRGRLYVTFASHGDVQPVHGWLLAFDTTSLRLLASFCTSPDGTLATSWMAGASPAIDDEGNVYCVTGNGDTTAPKGGRDYGESLLKIATTQASAGTLNVADYFTPSNYEALNRSDLDLGSGGIMLMPISGQKPHRLILGGKEGILFLLDTNQLGGLAPSAEAAPGHAVQVLKSLGHLQAATYHEINIINSPACFCDWLYYTSRSDPVTQFLIEPDGKLRSDPIHRAADHFNFAPPTPSISSNGNRDGIVWVINNGNPATLLAYDASDVSRRLYDSNGAGSRDRLDGGVKFSLPTVANGQVFVGTQDNLSVFGLLPAAKVRPADPSDLLVSVVDAHHIDLSWQRHSDDETSFRIERAANDEQFRAIDMTGHGTSSYADRAGVSPDTVYRYRITAVNGAGDSRSIESERVTTPAAPPDPALIAHWAMDEGTGSRVADSAGNAPVDGTVHGEVVWAQGHVGAGALGFHGAGVAPGYVEIPDAPKLRFTRQQSFTISAWVEPAAPPGKWAGIVTRSGATGLWCDDHDRWCFGSAGDERSVAAGTVGLGWHQVVGVQDAQANRRFLYVDGQKLAETNGPIDADAAGDIWIGGSKGDDRKYIDARIDDVRVFNRPLSASDITALFARHNPPAPEKLSAELSEHKATKLRWSIAAPEPGALPSTLRVERSISGAPFSQIARISGRSTHYDDAFNAACSYRITAENSAGDSESVVAAAKVPAVLIESISERSAATPATIVRGWKTGERLLMDRDFRASTTVTKPNTPTAAAIDLRGAEVIRTANEDKHPADYQLTYKLSEPCRVYLMIDQRNLPAMPGGASDFVDTHTQLEMGPPGTYEVFVATQPAGEHMLGPHVTGNSFYWLAVIPASR